MTEIPRGSPSLGWFERDYLSLHLFRISRGLAETS